jgi:hypothetical protein
MRPSTCTILVGIIVLAMPLTNAADARAGNIQGGTLEYVGEVSQRTGGLIQSFFVADVGFPPGAYDMGTLTNPGPNSPITLRSQFRQLIYGATFRFQADMQAQFPFGAYTFNVENSHSGATDSLTINHTKDAYPDSLPLLTAASYQALQHYDPTKPLTVSWNPYVVDPNAGASDITYGIIPPGGGYVFGKTVVPSSTTSCTIPANGLAFNTTYSFLLGFDSKINTGANPPQDVSFGYFEYVNFTTATPEPSSLALLGTGAVGLVGYACRRRRRVA